MTGVAFTTVRYTPDLIRQEAVNVALVAEWDGKRRWQYTERKFDLNEDMLIMFVEQWFGKSDLSLDYLCDEHTFYGNLSFWQRLVGVSENPLQLFHELALQYL